MEWHMPWLDIRCFGMCCHELLVFCHNCLAQLAGSIKGCAFVCHLSVVLCHHASPEHLAFVQACEDGASRIAAPTDDGDDGHANDGRWYASCCAATAAGSCDGCDEPSPVCSCPQWWSLKFVFQFVSLHHRRRKWQLLWCDSCTCDTCTFETCIGDNCDNCIVQLRWDYAAS